MFRIHHKFLSFMLVVFLLKRKQETSQKVTGSRLKIKTTFKSNYGFKKKSNKDYLSLISKLALYLLLMKWRVMTF